MSFNTEILKCGGLRGYEQQNMKYAEKYLLQDEPLIPIFQV